MKKEYYGIIGLCSAVVLLGGGLAALKLTDKSDKNSSTSSSITEEAVFGAEIVLVEDSNELPSSTTADVTQAAKLGVASNVKVTNGQTVLDVIIEKEPESGSDSPVYTLKGYEDLPVKNLMVGTLANNLNGIRSASIVEEKCTDFDKFGLGSTAIKVEYTYKSGVKRVIYIGDKSPVTSNNYVRLEGSDTVYTAAASSLANFSAEPKTFIDLTVMEKPEDDDMPRIDSLVIERKDLDEEFEVVYDPDNEIKTGGGTTSDHIMKKPTECYVTVEKLKGVIDGVFGLTADSIHAIHCTESDVAQTGLNDPFCRVTTKCDDGKTYVLLLSEVFKDEEGEKKCYGMLEGGKIIYIFTPETAKWVDLKPIDVASRLMIVNYVWNLSELDITAGSKTESFRIEPKNSSKERPDCKAEDMDVTRSGESFNSERYRQLYAFIIKANAEDFAYNEKLPTSEPMVTIKFKDAVLNRTKTYDFYDHSAMNCLIAVDGESKFLCSKSYVKTLIENIGKVETGEGYKESWE